MIYLFSTEWLIHINNKFNLKKSGQFLAYDVQKNPVLFEWNYCLGTDPNLIFLIQNCAPLTLQEFVPIELNFLKTYPEVVFQSDHFKEYISLFAQGVESVDWNKVEEKVHARINLVMDPENWPQDIKSLINESVFFIVQAKDVHTQELYGYITFFTVPAYGYGALSLDKLVVDSRHETRGLNKLLMSSIFALLPETQRIFDCIRPNYAAALADYFSWGFTVDEQPIQDPLISMQNMSHWVHVEYRAHGTNELQNTAQFFVE